MLNEGFIDVDFYEGGKWVTRRYPVVVAANLVEQMVQNLPREVAANLIRGLMASLGAHEPSRPEQFPEDRRMVLVE
jgi:hypothetical protein